MKSAWCWRAAAAPCRLLKLLLTDNGGGHAQILGTHQGVGIGLVAHHKTHMDVLVVLEIADDVLAVAATARNKDGDVHDG